MLHLLTAVLLEGQTSGLGSGWELSCSKLVLPASSNTAPTSDGVIGIATSAPVPRSVPAAAKARLPANCGDTAATKCVLLAKAAAKPAFVGGSDPLAELLPSSVERGLHNAFSSTTSPASSLAADGAVGDLDGDGDLDVIVGSKNAVVMLNNGNGGFTAGNTIGSGTTSNAAYFGGIGSDTGDLPLMMGNGRVVLGDIDGDGDLDVFIGVRALLFTNSGSASFTHVTGTAWSPTLSDAAPSSRVHEVQSIQLGDMDGDNDLDLVIGMVKSSVFYLQVWKNDGSGTFSGPGSGTNGYELGAISTTLRRHGFVMLGDLDGDGDLDCFAGQTSYFNDGTGTLTVKANSAVPYFGITGGGSSARESAYDLGDIDSDGDLDVLIVANSYNGLYKNDGSGTLTKVEPSAISANLMASTSGLFAGTCVLASLPALIPCRFSLEQPSPREFTRHLSLLCLSACTKLVVRVFLRLRRRRRSGCSTLQCLSWCPQGDFQQ